MDAQSLDFELPSQSVLRGLDEAHEQGFRRFCGAHNLYHHAHASGSLDMLQEKLKGDEPPDYDDPIVAAAYLLGYHLSHCMMTYWAFKHLFGHVGGIPNTLYVCDVGAGTGAARVGLALALLQLKDPPSTIYFHACEPSDMMHKAGTFFWKALRQSASAPERLLKQILPIDQNYWEYGTPPERLPDIQDDALRVVTAFHLSLPYDDPWRNDIKSTRLGKSARDSIQSALRLVSSYPHAGLFSANSNKARSLKQAVDDYDCKFSIPSDHRGVRRDSSRLHTQCEEEFGFGVTEGWSRRRFGRPSGVLLLQDKRAKQEERYQQRRAVPVLRPERRQQELAHYNRGLAYARKGEYDLAIQAYNQALAHKPNLDPAYYNRGIAYARKGEYRRAESDFSKALALGYDRAKVEAQLAELRQERERRERVEREERERQQRAAAPRSPAGPAGMPGHRVKAERQAAARAELQRRERAARAEAERRERAERQAALRAGLQRRQQKRQRRGILGRLWNALKRN